MSLEGDPIDEPRRTDMAERALVVALIILVVLAGLTLLEGSAASGQEARRASPGGLRRPPDRPAAACLIQKIEHQVDSEKTRLILRASSPIDYRGGSLLGSQVLLDLANAGISLASPVVEIGSPEVTRIIFGPELTRDGVRLLKVRLTGVRASQHKVIPKGNELHVELRALEGSRDRQKGLPKLIRNDAQVTASASQPGRGGAR